MRIVTVLLIAALAVSACGRKGPPVAPTETAQG
ncbi:LPS translocon maturation chaperone LptM [Pontivivens insulae]